MRPERVKQFANNMLRTMRCGSYGLPSRLRALLLLRIPSHPKDNVSAFAASGFQGICRTDGARKGDVLSEQAARLGGGLLAFARICSLGGRGSSKRAGGRRSTKSQTPKLQIPEKLQTSRSKKSVGGTAWLALGRISPHWPALVRILGAARFRRRQKHYGGQGGHRALPYNVGRLHEQIHLRQGYGGRDRGQGVAR